MKKSDETVTLETMWNISALQTVTWVYVSIGYTPCLVIFKRLCWISSVIACCGASFSNFPREISRRSRLNPTPTCAMAKFESQREKILSFHHLWRGSMKLKHPVVLSLTSICHCNLEREGGSETDRKKDKDRGMCKGVRGDDSWSEWTGQCAGEEWRRWGGGGGMKGSVEIEEEGG